MFKLMFLFLIVFVAFVVVAIYEAQNLDKKRIAESPNFVDGKAQNREPMEIMSGESGDFIPMMIDTFFKNKPKGVIPSVKTDLKSLDKNEDAFVWLGHSTIFLQLDSKRILIDPLLAEAASPVPFINEPFMGTAIYSPDDIPEIDYLIITHDHYDHLSKPALRVLYKKINKAICPLGVGKYLRNSGIPKENIIEMDWDEDMKLENGLIIHALTARHFSGRSFFSRNNNLWASYLIETPERKVYISGDSGYGEHFKEIGERFGKIDIAFLENGQYNEHWKNVHMMPAETKQASLDLNAEYVMPIHNSKYKISLHNWDEPLVELSKLYEGATPVLMTPMIGERAPLWYKSYDYKKWWE